MLDSTWPGEADGRTVDKPRAPARPRQDIQRLIKSPVYRLRHRLASLVRKLRSKPAESLEEFLARRFGGKRPAPARKPLRAKGLGDKLWGGFSTYARADLEALANSTASSKEERVEAAWQLARWHAAQQDDDAALRCMWLVALLAPKLRLAKRQLLLETDLLLRTGKREEAKILIDLGTKRYSRHDTDLCLLAANALIGETPETGDTDERRLDLINRIYLRHGLQPVRRIDPQRPLGIDNITAAAPAEAQRTDGPKVSVIMPAFNAAATIGFALRGLLEQTWRNLEILVVDDASTDNTAEIAEAAAAADPRVRVIRLTENGGCYVARNKGLEQASGECLTVHDADDWSHSQKVEKQVAECLKDVAVASVSFWARADRNLRFVGSRKASEMSVTQNNSSLMLRTRVVKELGGWDPVRTSADTELIMRLEAKFGRKQMASVCRKIPLSFWFENERSLTRHGSTHIGTLDFGSRHEYRRAAARWHSCAAKSGDFRISASPSAPRSFPAPALMCCKQGTASEYDLILVADFAITGGAFISSYQYLLAALKNNLRVGIFHWRRYDLPISRPIDERVAALIDQFEIDMIVANQETTTKHLVFYYPPILQYKLDSVPIISFDRMYVIVNQAAQRLYSGGDPQYDPAVVRENLEALFGSAGQWLAVSPLVRKLMELDRRYPRPGDAIWMPLLETDEWCQDDIRWRGALQATPILGRHGGDRYTKWPQTREAIEQAYCVHRKWETRFLGGAEHAMRILGKQPRNWKTWPFDKIDVRNFLCDLDFLVHFPYEDMIEAFGRCAMEAMAVGVPVILPPRFADTFGNAAVYCEPMEVAERIEELWHDERKYLRQAHAGREFVLNNCSFDQLPRRLAM